MIGTWRNDRTLSSEVKEKKGRRYTIERGKLTFDESRGRHK